MRRPFWKALLDAIERQHISHLDRTPSLESQGPTREIIHDRQPLHRVARLIAIMIEIPGSGRAIMFRAPSPDTVLARA